VEDVGIEMSYIICTMQNQLYRFSHQIPLYKMSGTYENAPIRCCFMLDHAPLSIETCQLAVLQD